MRLRSARCRRKRSGAAAVEMAFMLPVFFTLAFAQVETARLGMVTQMLTIAAREGAREAVLPKTTALSSVQAKVNGVLSGTGIDTATMTVSPSSWLTDPGGTAITVTLSVSYGDASWLPTPMFFGSTILNGKATLSSERP